MVVFIVILIIFAVLAAGFFIGSRIAYGMSFERRGDGKPDPYVGLERESFLPYSEKIRASIDRLSATPCEEIRIKSHDGLTLSEDIITSVTAHRPRYSSTATARCP